MSKDNRDFFKEKKEWSRIKDDLLACYLKPYFSKIIHTGKPVNYIDCFAGAGKFEDSNNGSPLIAYNIQKKCLSITQSSCSRILNYFIEPKVFNELKENTRNLTDIELINGQYEDTILGILQTKRNENIFLYIDPFGVKCLPFYLYDKYSQGQFCSIELLINFNSFGFIREACRTLKASVDIIYRVEKLATEFMFFFEDSLEADDLTKVAGGTYWISIVKEYISNKITCYEAEQKISNEYCNQLRKRFKYVLNMPIRLAQNQQPKYRMIHATNNEDGCYLMYQNMCNRWEALSNLQLKKNPPSLFEENMEQEIIDIDEIKRNLLIFLENYSDYENITPIISNFISNHGIICKYLELKDCFKSLEKNGKISVKRDPAFTSTGKLSTFWEEVRKEKHFVRIKVN